MLQNVLKMSIFLSKWVNHFPILGKIHFFPEIFPVQGDRGLQKGKHDI